jgi:hypothetical protein
MYINLNLFNIDINNDKLLKTIWKHKEKNKSIVTDSAQQRGAQIYSVGSQIWLDHYIDWLQLVL